MRPGQGPLSQSGLAKEATCMGPAPKSINGGLGAGFLCSVNAIYALKGAPCTRTLTKDPSGVSPRGQI